MRLPASDASHKSGPPILLADQLYIGVSHDPLFSFENMLENLLAWPGRTEVGAYLGLVVYCLIKDMLIQVDSLERS